MDAAAEAEPGYSVVGAPDQLGAGVAIDVGDVVPIADDGQPRLRVFGRCLFPSGLGLRVATFESSFDTVVAAYTGDRLGTLAEVACNHDAGGGYQSEVTWDAVAGTMAARAKGEKARRPWLELGNKWQRLADGVASPDRPAQQGQQPQPRKI